MRMMKMCGAPRDRRIDRGKVAMAAAAVLFLSATVVRAQAPVDFVIDASRSYLSVVGGGFQPGNAQGQYNPASFLAASAEVTGINNGPFIPGGSLNAPLYGHLYAGVNPGTSIQFYSTGSSTPQMSLKVTGNYTPGEDNNGNVTSTAPSQPGNFGAKVSAIAAFERAFLATYDSLVSLDPTLSGPSALAITGGNSFDVSGIVLHQITGYTDIVTGIGAGPYHIDQYGDDTPINAFSTYDPNTGLPQQGYNSVTGTIDPTTFHLVIPFNFLLYNQVVVGTNIDYQVVTLRGQIVADPVVPEPSTITLLGFGVVGLLSYAWRARKRKALVA